MGPPAVVRFSSYEVTTFPPEFGDDEKQAVAHFKKYLVLRFAQTLETATERLFPVL